MSGLSQAVRKALLDHYFGKSTLTAPANIFVALSTTAPTSTGTNVTEPSGGGYARASTAPTDWNAATTADPSETNNANAVTFAAASADWVAGANLAHFALYDAATAGNFIGAGPLDVAKPVLSGDTPSFSAGSLKARLSWTA